VDRTRIDKRIHHALAANRRAERIIVGLALGIFTLGAGALAVAYCNTNSYIAAGAVLLQALLYRPVAAIRRLRRENVSLQAVRVFIAEAPPERAMHEVAKVLEFIRAGK
jgi:hypothetical protein